MRIIDSYNRFNDRSVNTTLQGQAPQASSAAQRGTAESAHEGTSASKGDAVEVSAQAMELARKAAADTDTAKVQRLRSAIDDGSFVIDRHAIASRIVDGG
jgi:flagellar biosynthesis anti-sigma factor FlgM